MSSPPSRFDDPTPKLDIASIPIDPGEEVLLLGVTGSTRIEVLDPRIEPLVAIRSRLLGQRTVRASYTGYAVAQARRLANRQAEGRKGFNSDLAKRTAKHARHCFRLMLQAEQLLRTGEVTVDVLRAPGPTVCRR
ncbi:MAG: hypothetical protein AAF567_21285 [Actinomycetota bacterium]